MSVRFRDHDQLDETLSPGGLALDVYKNRSTPLDVEVVVNAVESGRRKLLGAIAPNGKWVYASNAGAVGIFAIQNDGSLISSGEADGLPKAAGVQRHSRSLKQNSLWKG